MKRKHKEIRKAILEILNDGKFYVYGTLERKINTNWQTIRDHCTDLKLFGAVIIEDNKVKITKQGIVLLKKIKDLR